MDVDAIIPVLLLVACLFAGVMTYVSRKKIPEVSRHTTRRASSMDGLDALLRARQESLSRNRSAGVRERPRSGSGLGRDTGPRIKRQSEGTDPLGRGERRRTRSENGTTGQGYGYGGRAHYDESGRFHSDFGQPRNDSAEDRKQAPPPPTPPPPPHWSAILGVSRNANVREIRAAYASLMRTLHPDLVPQTPDTSRRCTEVQGAYERARREAREEGRE